MTTPTVRSSRSDGLAAPDAPAGLVLAGYVAAGAPASLHPLYIRPERWRERRRLVLAANGRRLDERQAETTGE